MSDHDHSEFVEGCFRCDLSREETRMAPTLDEASRRRLLEAKPKVVYRPRPEDKRGVIIE